ncbi:hypothetical protein [Massilia sp.]|uniref:hypothetical protein n=1 Tax=Massilia sp. TaxID=1882437 RepID=UPI0028A77656|nr:hypothetical protein [Massilia sp.]
MNRNNRIRPFPFASKSFSSDENPWSTLKDASGTTPTENQLLHLARTTFLSLWSFPNVYTDEGRRSASSDGKELCDLMVVFGDDVLLFSDKNCAFPSISDLNLAWSRWYRRAVEKSAKQLAGAESWIRRFPNRIFLDAKCGKTLPVELPPLERRRVHLIAVAHGASDAAIKYWESFAPGSNGTPIIDTHLVGRQHEAKPFTVGWPLVNKRFVHVFDDHTISLVLGELDTLSDFVNYLTKKQELFEKSSCEFLITGEEELLATYLSSTDPKTKEHRFPTFPENHLVFLDEGNWSKLKSSVEYRARAAANELSYLWDDLIEYQASHMMCGSSDFLAVAASKGSEEIVLRVMASEKRMKRRILGESIHYLRRKSNDLLRSTRSITDRHRRRVYAMLALPYFPEQPHDAYRNYRQHLLYVYCEGALLQFPEAEEIVGIAFENYDSDIFSADFLYIRTNGVQLERADQAEIRTRLREHEIWNPSVISSEIRNDSEFPFTP